MPESENTTIVLDVSRFNFATREAFARQYGITPTRLLRNINRFGRLCAVFNERAKSGEFEGIDPDCFIVASYDPYNSTVPGRIIGIGSDLDELYDQLREDGISTGKTHHFRLRNYTDQSVPE